MAASGPPHHAPGLTVVGAPSASLSRAAGTVRPGAALGLVPAYADSLAVGRTLVGIGMPTFDRDAAEAARAGPSTTRSRR